MREACCQKPTTSALPPPKQAAARAPTASPRLQVSSPEDASNFEAPQTNPAKRNSRYVSTGVFKDF